jgi:AcrR family transcriptional regulator/DNA-binding MarR family transcriptional regulator
VAHRHIPVEFEGRSTARVAEIQRSRLLAGALRAIEDVGYPETTVAQITLRSRVSRRTFYELFDNREACLLALIDDFLATLERELHDANLGALPWRERVRGGLAVILCFLDREPVLARACVFHALRGGSTVLERRGEILKRLAAIIDEGREGAPRASGCTSLTAEGLVGAAFWIICERLAPHERTEEPLIGLLGELMGMIVLPYLGAGAARREQSRPAPRAPRTASSEPVLTPPEYDPLQDVSMRLTYRTARVLQSIAERPGISNRHVAEHSGIQDQGQVSKLLARMERIGLTTNTGDGHVKGAANAWRLTALGEQVAQRLSTSIHESKAA